MSPDDFGSPATPPRGCVTLASWLAVVLGILLAALRAARADDHAPLTCDPVCVVRYCESRCGGPHRDRLQGEADCKRECVRVVTEGGCWPCKDEKRDQKMDDKPTTPHPIGPLPPLPKDGCK